MELQRPAWAEGRIHSPGSGGNWEPLETDPKQKLGQEQAGTTDTRFVKLFLEHQSRLQGKQKPGFSVIRTCHRFL